jgi:hypothetical protein
LWISPSVVQLWRISVFAKDSAVFWVMRITLGFADILLAMQTDPIMEWQRLAEHDRGLHDEELCALAIEDAPMRLRNAGARVADRRSVGASGD